ncbi:MULTISPECIES: hypothetical protein [Enterobacter cloacae complex]|uniref:phage tail fiber protein n=2 Tax=Enterobacteriaceae TaxID=543 RepID=UPI0004D14C02|nr:MULTISPECIES: hypothetical protein [Enterobacter cloacae complex]AIE62258.1 hypothetical protein ECNIH2_02440 [Enterobacter cloacae ECNIH2]MCK6988574.1 hypothetical protein [Enterobacter cloacae]
MLSEGDFGVGLLLSSSNAKPINPATSAQPGPTGFGYWAAADNVGAFPGQWQSILQIGVGGATYSQMAFTCLSSTRAALRVSNGSAGFTGWAEFYTTSNTTKASDGTLKAASPVARIVASQEECQRADIAEDGFVWCGCGTANAEAEGVILSRLDVGVYVLAGSAGLASEGWQLLPPMDPGGMGELGVVEAEQTDSGQLTIRLFKRKYILSDEGEVIKTKGEPMDVPANSWIDVRLDMPDDSLFNQRMSQESKV